MNHFLQAYPALANKPYFLFLSRIHSKKGCDNLVEAFSQLAEANPNIHLVMAGPAESKYLDTLQSKAPNADIANRIHWTGMLQSEMKWGAIQGSSAFILPSHQENFGIAAIESLACGKPVLISDKVNIWREIVADGAGMVEADSSKGCIKLIQRWLDLSEPEKAETCRNALDTYMRRFTVEAAAQTFLAAVRNSQ